MELLHSACEKGILEQNTNQVKKCPFDFTETVVCKAVGLEMSGADVSEVDLLKSDKKSVMSSEHAICK